MRRGRAKSPTGLSNARRHTPEPHLLRARLLFELDRHDEALLAIDAGIEQLGPLVVFVELAIEIELDRERPRAALARMDALAPNVGRSPHWLQRRGDLLRRCGDDMLAMLTYGDALARIDALPSARRRAPATAKLQASLYEALGVQRPPRH